MRREGMYTSGLYVQSTKTYYGGRKAWKKGCGHKKKWGWAAGIFTIGLLVLAVNIKTADFGCMQTVERTVSEEEAEKPKDVFPIRTDAEEVEPVEF